MQTESLPKRKRYRPIKGPFASWEHDHKRMVDGFIGLLDDPTGAAMIDLALEEVDQEIEAARRAKSRALEAFAEAAAREAAALRKKGRIREAAKLLHTTGQVDPILWPSAEAEVARRLGNAAAATRREIRESIDLSRPNEFMAGEGFELEATRIDGRKLTVTYARDLGANEIPDTRVESAEVMRSRAARYADYYFYSAPWALGIRAAPRGAATLRLISAQPEGP